MAVAVTTQDWDGSEARYPDAESYCNASLHNGNEGPVSGWTKSNCALPVHEPSGELNVHAMSAAAAALVGGRGGVNLPAPAKRAAAIKLAGLYRTAKLDPPPALLALAHGAMNDAIRARVGH
jgi:hypothetical protein